MSILNWLSGGSRSLKKAGNQVRLDKIVGANPSRPRGTAVGSENVNRKINKNYRQTVDYTAYDNPIGPEPKQLSKLGQRTKESLYSNPGRVKVENTATPPPNGNTATPPPNGSGGGSRYKLNRGFQGDASKAKRQPKPVDWKDLKSDLQAGKLLNKEKKTGDQMSLLGSWGAGNYANSLDAEGRSLGGAILNDAMRGAVGGAAIGGTMEASQGGSFWAGAKEGAFNGGMMWTGARSLQRATGAESMVFGKNSIYKGAKGMVGATSGSSEKVAQSAKTLLKQRHYEGLSRAVTNRMNNQ